MTPSMRTLMGGTAAVVVLAALAAAPPAGASGSFSCTATGAVSVAARIVAPFVQANPAGTPCRTATARFAGALIPPQPGQQAAATIRAHTRAHPRRAVARVVDRHVSLVLDGHTYTAARVRASVVVRCRAGVPIVSSAGAVRGLSIDGGAPFDAVGPRTVTLADGTVVLLNDVLSGPGGSAHVIRDGLRVVTPPVPASFTFASADAAATGDPCGA